MNSNLLQHNLRQLESTQRRYLLHLENAQVEANQAGVTGGNDLRLSSIEISGKLTSLARRIDPFKPAPDLQSDELSKAFVEYNTAALSLSKARLSHFQSIGIRHLLDEAPKFQALTDNHVPGVDTDLCVEDPTMIAEIRELMTRGNLQIWMIASGVDELTILPEACSRGIRLLAVSLREFPVLEIESGVLNESKTFSNFDTEAVNAFDQLYHPFAEFKVEELLGFELKSVYKYPSLGTSSHTELLQMLGYSVNPTACEASYWEKSDPESKMLSQFRDKVLSGIITMYEQNHVTVRYYTIGNHGDAFWDEQHHIIEEYYGPQTREQFERNFTSRNGFLDLSAKFVTLEHCRFDREYFDIPAFLEKNGFKYDTQLGTWVPSYLP